MLTNLAGDPALEAKRLEFEVLISDLSARFVNLLAGKVDGEIEDALCKVGAFFDVDRCALLEIPEDVKEAHITHYFVGDGIPDIPKKIDYARLFPWEANRLINRREVLNFHTRDLPTEATVDRASAEALGIKSFLTIPLLYEGAVRYLIAINAVREERVWPAVYIPRLQLVGEILLNALMRERADRLERFLSDISARFVHLPSDRFDDEIRETQNRICHALGIDRSGIWQFADPGHRDTRLTHIYQPPDGPPLPENPDLRENVPVGVLADYMRGETVLIPSVEDLPAEAAVGQGKFPSGP